MNRHDDITSTDQAEIEALRERVRGGRLDPQDLQLLDRLLNLLLALLKLIQQKNASISRLKRLLFGPRADRRALVKEGQAAEAEPASAPASDQVAPPSPKAQRRGHGRMRAAAYTGARLEHCTDPALQPGDVCPHRPCPGHLYDTQAPSLLIRLTGQPIVTATRYEQQVLRCSACQERFVAPLPAGVAPQKYDATADVALALAKYGAGIPFYRLARQQELCGVPVPESVQFARCEAVADAVFPVYRQLVGAAGCSRLLYADDTRVKILSCERENKQLDERERRATQTSVVVAQVEGHAVVLYFSGRRHAGENIAVVLEGRPAVLGPPLQMGDALASNWSAAVETIEVKCWAHARRQFVELEANYPAECGHVLNEIGALYEAEAATRGMSARERLHYHQRVSGPRLTQLQAWVEQQLRARQVEPNSPLGKALAYLRRHWPELTQFLRIEQAPLDNNPAVRSVLPK